ncbi:FAD binding domain-containing protein [Colletotrichum karsti]|uniref:FAD binding domain-containing protein n=1 Tax=Colletotrichum karsti TaxID=1095194 RepID=A0A9P6LF57_9PEZI|nr:FAD binding domain-containing protein [Colletotrichum karsti]KAF9869972.1 FAD binding domain-containing protein [Colletotrichum karsti]
MYFSGYHAVILGLLGVTGLTHAAGNQTDYVQPVQDKAFNALREAEAEAVLKRNSTCTLENAAVRKSWEALTGDERKSYIRAVKCLFSSPSQTDPSLNTGARNRYDDFAAQHINQTMTVHVTGNFLTWHRHYIWSYEQALRNECGYTGYLPYWNWFSYQDNLRKSPVFDGSETSMGSDGLFVPHNGSIGPPGFHIPSGDGGGCIATGPFANLSANLGPVQPQQDGLVGVGLEEKLRYNPHCVKRDLSNWLASRIYTEDALLNSTIRETAKDIASFQTSIDSQSYGFPGVHAGGHQTISGSNSDLYSGVVDPAFYLHHTMVDRMYWLWQALHLDQAKTISGTITFGNSPPSRNATVDDLIELPFLGVEPATLGSLLDTLDGPYCYVYA